MSDYSKILDSEIDEPNSILKKAIRKKWIKIVFNLIFCVLIYFIGKFTETLDSTLTTGFAIGSGIGSTLRYLVIEKKLIYYYSIEKQFLTIYLANIFGKKKTKTFALNEIQKSKFRKRNFWRDSDKLWLQISKSIHEYSFIGKGIGKNLIKDLNIIKKKT